MTVVVRPNPDLYSHLFWVRDDKGALSTIDGGVCPSISLGNRFAAAPLLKLLYRIENDASAARRWDLTSDPWGTLQACKCVGTATTRSFQVFRDCE